MARRTGSSWTREPGTVPIPDRLVKTDGPFKYLFKWVKGLMGWAGLDRLFITGVSPMVMSDVTSGMNIARNVYLKPALADLCGFTDTEVDDLLTMALRECGGELEAEGAKLMMREWYNGYRFALGVSERVYNPEPELDHRHADLCLLRRPDARASSLWDLLFEFKRLPLGFARLVVRAS